MSAVPINAIVNTILAETFSGKTTSVYFSEIHARVSQQVGNVGEGFLEGAIESLGYSIHGSIHGRVVRA